MSLRVDTRIRPYHRLRISGRATRNRHTHSAEKILLADSKSPWAHARVRRSVDVSLAACQGFLPVLDQGLNEPSTSFRSWKNSQTCGPRGGTLSLFRVAPCGNKKAGMNSCNDRSSTNVLKLRVGGFYDFQWHAVIESDIHYRSLSRLDPMAASASLVGLPLMKSNTCAAALRASRTRPFRTRQLVRQQPRRDAAIMR